MIENKQRCDKLHKGSQCVYSYVASYMSCCLTKWVKGMLLNTSLEMEFYKSLYLN